MTRTLPVMILWGLVLLAPALKAQDADEKQKVQQAFKHAQTLKTENKLAEAIQELTAVLPRMEKLYGEDHVQTANVLHWLALSYAAVGQYAQAETLYQRSLKIREDKLGPNHLTVAASLHTLASLYREMGQYAKAEPLYQRSLKIWEAKLGPNHPEVANSLNHLAEFYRDLGQYAKAEGLLQRSLKIREDKWGPDHLTVASSLNSLGVLYQDMGQYAKAESFYQRSLKIREDQLGPDHPAVATSLSNLGVLYRKTGQYDKAEPLLQRSLKIRKEKFGPDHITVAFCLHSLALLYGAMGQYDKAEPLIQRSLDVHRARLGRGHPRSFTVQSNLVVLLLRTGRTTEAFRLMHQTVQLNRAHQVQVLPILSEKEQLQFLASSHILRRALSMALAVPLDSENVVRSASWVLNSKGVAQQALAERTLLARDAHTLEAENLLRELTACRQELSKLSTEISPTGQKEEEAWKKRREVVTRKERLLSAQLSKLDQRSLRDDPWIDLDDVTRRLPERSALVDIARFPVIDLKTPGKQKEKPAHYVAWVTRKNGEAHLVDLGEAGPIDERITRVRRELAGAPERLRKEGEVQAEQAAPQALQALADKVLQPLRQHLDDCTQWVISPDGNLWLVPWAALPLDEKTYAIEKHTIGYVISGRDLVLNPLKLDRKPGRPLVVADPDFDLGVDEASRRAREKVGQPRSGQRNLSEDLKLGRVPRLLSTALEGRVVARRLEKPGQEEPLLLTGPNALAEVVRAAASPGVLVLSTHGFFLPEQETNAGKPGNEEDDAERHPGVHLENPLLRCGLLLAGCNHVGEGAKDRSTGVLTGLDVVSMDLRGTELVVLSACETGLGDTHNGEGVAGLRQAFQLAGAEAVLASLWSVADRESARLMVDFWDNLAQKPGKAEALRQAQLKMIRARREANAAAHPFFWAAFTLTGLSEERK